MTAKRPLGKDALRFSARISELYRGIAADRLPATGAEQHDE